MSQEQTFSKDRRRWMTGGLGLAAAAGGRCLVGLEPVGGRDWQ